METENDQQDQDNDCFDGLYEFIGEDPDDSSYDNDDNEE